MDKEYAKYLIENTTQNYDLLAESYTRTRAFIPKDIREMGEYAKPGDRVLDLGSASGRFFEVFEGKDIDYVGVDISKRLIGIAKNNYPKAKFQVANALDLPFDESSFDKVFSVSVIHNIPSRDFQLQYLKEARRALKPKGVLILRVWDFWKRKSFPRLLLKYTFLKIIGKSKLDFKDVFVPWKDSNGGVLAQRYFHCFTKREIEKLAKEAGFEVKKIWRAGKDPRTNIYLIAERRD